MDQYAPLLPIHILGIKLMYIYDHWRTGGDGGGAPSPQTESTMAFFVFIHNSICHQVETFFLRYAPDCTFIKSKKKAPYSERRGPTPSPFGC